MSYLPIGCRIGIMSPKNDVIIPSLSLTAASSFCSSRVVHVRIPKYTTPPPSVGAVACSPGCVVSLPL
eukprot:8485542-Pyramimonas_sp.AAC.1